MPTYITLFRYTQQGIQTIKDGSARLDAGKAAIQAVGGKFIGFYLTMGQYDAVLISELPDDEAAARLLLAQGALGNVRTETLRAFTEDEFRRIIAALP